MKIYFQIFFILVALFKVNPVNSQTIRPTVLAAVGGKSSDSVSKNQISLQEGVSGHWKVTEDHWEKMIIDSFSLMILRDTMIIFKHRNFGNRFDQKIKTALGNLAKGDRVLLFNIYGNDPNRNKIFLSPLEYVIK